MLHLESDNRCSWKQPGLYAWNSENGINSFPEILTAIKIEIPHTQERHSS